MSIATTSMRNDYTGAGTTSVFSFTFKVFSSADLRVISRDITTGVDTVLALTTDYTVTGVGATAGGTITLVAGNLATGKHLTIKRLRAATQGTDIRNQGDYYPETIEDTFDQLVMMVQQLTDEANRSARLAESLTVSDFNPRFLATIAGSVSKIPVTNSSGNGWADPATWPSPAALAAAAAGVIVSGSRGTPNLLVAGTAIVASTSAAEFHTYVAGNAAPVTMIATPQVAAGTSLGQKMLIIGRDDTNTVTLTNSTGLSLNGDITLGADDTLYLYWDGTNWSEITRRR